MGFDRYVAVPAIGRQQRSSSSSSSSIKNDARHGIEKIQHFSCESYHTGCSFYKFWLKRSCRSRRLLVALEAVRLPVRDASLLSVIILESVKLMLKLGSFLLTTISVFRRRVIIPVFLSHVQLLRISVITDLLRPRACMHSIKVSHHLRNTDCIWLCVCICEFNAIIPLPVVSLMFVYVLVEGR